MKKKHKVPSKLSFIRSKASKLLPGLYSMIVNLTIIISYPTYNPFFLNGNSCELIPLHVYVSPWEFTLLLSSENIK